MIIAGAPYRDLSGNENQGVVYAFAKPGGGWVDATETAELTAADGAADDTFGRSVAVSGNTIATGAPYSRTYQGAAYVFLHLKTDQTIHVVTDAPPSAAFGTRFTVAATGGGSGNPVTYGS